VQIGLIATSSGLLPLLLAFAVGRRADVWGAGRLLVAGAVLSVTGSTTALLAPGLPVLYGAAAALGLAHLLFLVGHQSAVSQAATAAERDRGFGALTSASSVGQFLGRRQLAALAELLARGGERVGLLGGPPFTGRAASRRVAEMLLGDTSEDSLPPNAKLSRFSECLLFSDFLEPVGAMAERFEAIAAQGVRGHLVQVLDPAEESLPYAGRTEFAASEGRDRVMAGRAESLRESYQERLKRHRTDLAEATRRLGWSFIMHHTDRPPEEAVLAIHGRVAGIERDYRYRPARPVGRGTAEAGTRP